MELKANENPTAQRENKMLQVAQVLAGNATPSLSPGEKNKRHKKHVSEESNSHIQECVHLLSFPASLGKIS